MPTAPERNVSAPASSISGENARSLETQARAALQASAYPAVRRVECVYRDGAVTLTGRLPSFYLKQIAQSEVRRRLEHADIRNQVEVSSIESHP